MKLHPFCAWPPWPITFLAAIGLSLMGNPVLRADPTAQPAPVWLDPVVVEAAKWSKPWYLARADGLEVLTQASLGESRDYVARLLRGRRLIPDFLLERGPAKVRFILVDESKEARGLKPRSPIPALIHYGPGVLESREDIYLADAERITVAENFGGVTMNSQVWTGFAAKLMERQQPPLPPWLFHGVFGSCGALSRVLGVPNSTTIKIARLLWPGAKDITDPLPPGADDLPDFSAMFDPLLKVEATPQEARARFEFQCGLFVRWSLFGPAKNGRDRNAFWAFAEFARRGQATEVVFHQYYGMDWSAARREMRAYLKGKGVGLVEARMPGVMADVPEAEKLEFREATPEEVKRILGEFRRLRERDAGKSTPAQR